MILQAWADSGCNSEVGNIWYHSWCRGDTVRWYTVYTIHIQWYTLGAVVTRPLSRFASTAVPPPLWENCLNLSDILLLYVSEIVRFDAVIHRTLVDMSLPRDCIEARQCVMALREKIVSVLKFGISAQYSHFSQLAADDGLVNLPIMILYRIPQKTFAPKGPSTPHGHHQCHHCHVKIDAIKTSHCATPLTAAALRLTETIAEDMKRFLCIGLIISTILLCPSSK